MRRWIKQAGLAGFVLGRWILPAQGVPILGYHSVDTSGSHISIAPDMFRVQMERLRDRGVEGVSLDVMLNRLAEDPCRNHPLAAITFDDGLLNFRKQAVPILNEFGFTATNFVPTDYVGRRAEWLPAYGVDAVPVMDKKMLRDMSDAGMDIQSHGCSHRRLSELSTTERIDEPRKSKEILETILGRPVSLFCYPFGDVDATYEGAVKEAGYRAAVTVRQGLHQPKTDNPFRLPRQNLDYLTIGDPRTAKISLCACLNGAFADYVKLRRRFRKGPPSEGVIPQVDKGNENVE